MNYQCESEFTVFETTDILQVVAFMSKAPDAKVSQRASDTEAWGDLRKEDLRAEFAKALGELGKSGVELRALTQNSAEAPAEFLAACKETFEARSKQIPKTRLVIPTFRANFGYTYQVPSVANPVLGQGV